MTRGEKAEILEVISKGHHGYQLGHCHRRGQRRQAFSCRMEDMGLRAGKIIEMLNNEGGGPLLLKVDDSRIAIGRGMAMKIMVRRKD